MLENVDGKSVVEQMSPQFLEFLLDAYRSLTFTWVLVNTLTIGTISVFYSHLEQQDQNNIGRFFSLKPDELKTILQVLTLYRNVCAHDERLYNVWS